MTFQPPGNLRMTWLIARRAALESLQDRSSLLTGLGSAIVLPPILAWLTVRSNASNQSSDGEVMLASALAVNLLVVGLVPTLSSAGVASGQFAGEKERGILTPLLASPASNLSIFGGKILGAVLPSLLYALAAELTYLLAVAALLGFGGLGLLPPLVSVAMVCMVVAMSCFAAVGASLISSRVRTFNAAQQISGLVLMPLGGGLVALALDLQSVGAGVFMGAVGGLLLVDVLVTAAAAATWRREEVLAQH